MGPPFDWPAIWCSLKILLLSIGLFLFVDAQATWALVTKHKNLAAGIYLLLAVPSLGFLFGLYCLAKSVF